MSYRAIHRFARISAQKVRPFANLIRGKGALEAMTILKFYPNRGARMLENVLNSAIHNAEDRRVQDLDELVVTDAHIDDGPRKIKRMRPKARGMASVITKMVSHITVTLTLPYEEAQDDQSEQ